MNTAVNGEMLSVYLNSTFVGRLWLDEERRFVFQYDETWLCDADAIPLSLSLPLRADVFGDSPGKGKVRAFFSNLLPEAELRSNIAKRLGLSEKNNFALLEVVGGEDRPNWVIERRWKGFAADVGVGFKIVRETLLKTSAIIHDAAMMEADMFYGEYGHCDIIENILTVVEKRSEKIIRLEL